jgi:uncharacterized protein (DUF2147 family)
MKTIVPALAAVAALVAAPAFAADVAGLWQTPTNGAQVQIDHCGAQLCGKLMTSNNIAANPAVKDVKNKDEGLRGRPLKGMLMLTGFTGGPQMWKDGKIYKADEGKTYSGTIEMTGPDSLKLKGCVVAPLCKTQVWTRVK